ncbi:hypothetical protein OFN97_00005 [Campylobacter sp. VBCF_05 NA6]|uniref:hypothetical protein n=1 Tax=unclassified Campylobacter TaxID=2593542 RepID=UPI0022E9E004|nr:MULTISPECIES: hypothetical protein [unclassified Campylobacter]MDA3057504.1 hypothetical protein [Campylobacter sp. VBCF_04 NA7]MDA3058404.1 hypothetical protein [Campylobacter sp. VBCF_05 NA6]
MREIFAVFTRCFHTLFSHAVFTRCFHTLFSHAVFTRCFHTLFSHAVLAGCSFPRQISKFDFKFSYLT